MNTFVTSSTDIPRFVVVEGLAKNQVRLVDASISVTQVTNTDFFDRHKPSHVDISGKDHTMCENSGSFLISQRVLNLSPILGSESTKLSSCHSLGF
jgi:uncharacterized protein YjbI with pentapeptide repeats